MAQIVFSPAPCRRKDTNYRKQSLNLGVMKLSRIDKQDIEAYKAIPDATIHRNLLPAMRDVVLHLHYGVRQLIRYPFFTIVTLFTLALGIGLTTAIFSFVDAVVIHPLNYPRSDELVTISQRSEIEGRTLQAGVSTPNVLDIQKESDIFEEVAYFRWQRPVLGMANPPKQLLGV